MDCIKKYKHNKIITLGRIIIYIACLDQKQTVSIVVPDNMVL